MNAKLTTDTKASVQLEDLSRLLAGVMERLITQEQMEKWLSEVFAMRVKLRTFHLDEAGNDGRFDLWTIHGL